MLLVGAFYGRAGGLILVGLLAASATAGATAAAQVGRRRQQRVPETLAAEVDDSYELDAGEIELDLTDVQDLEALDGRTIDVEAGVGQIEVIVPDGIDVDVDAEVGRRRRPTCSATPRTAAISATHVPGRRVDAPDLTIDAEVGFGEIEVHVEGRN